MSAYTVFQEGALTTVAFPKQHRLSYPTLGLVNEIGEYLEKIILYKIYDTAGDIVFTDPAHKDDLIDELGDILWYVAVLSHYAQIDIDEIFEKALKDVKSNTFTSFDKDPYLGMIMASATVSGVVKKVIRKDKNTATESDKLSEDVKNKIKTSLAQIVFFIAQAVREQRINKKETKEELVKALHMIMDRNLAKLKDRAERGVIKGSGDKR